MIVGRLIGNRNMVNHQELPILIGRKTRAGFTLIELLVVCAIISILATTALPNLLDAQIRAKATRVRTELNVIANAYLMYNIDNNSWPNHMDGDRAQHRPLTTPVSYITTSIWDLFQKSGRAQNDYYYQDSMGQYHAEPRAALYDSFRKNEPRYADDTRQAAFYVWSFGPDEDFDGTNQYDVTNGIRSNGDLYKDVLGGFQEGYPFTAIYPFDWTYGPPSRRH